MDDSRIFLDAGRIGVLLLGGNSQSGDTSHLSQTWFGSVGSQWGDLTIGAGWSTVSWL